MNRRARLRKHTRASSKGLRAANEKKEKKRKDRERKEVDERDERDGETRDRYAGFARVATQEKHDLITGA